MKHKVFLLFLGLLFASYSIVQSCDVDNIKKYVNSKKSFEIYNTITKFTLEFASSYAVDELQTLKCFLDYVTVKGTEEQIYNKGNLSDVIDNLINEKELILSLKNDTQLNKNELIQFKRSLLAYSKETHDIYTQYMTIIDKNTTLPKGRSGVTFDPKLVFPSYDKFLRLYKEKSGSIDFLVKNNVIKSSQDAQNLYDKLARLEVVLIHLNEKSRFDWVGNYKRSQQIISIKEIINALKNKFPAIDDFYTSLPRDFNEKLAVTTQKSPVIFAAVAVTLNRIIQLLKDKVQRITEER
jgi:hypothetical protein